MRSSISPPTEEPVVAGVLDIQLADVGLSLAPELTSGTWSPTLPTTATTPYWYFDNCLLVGLLKLSPIRT